MAWHGMDMEAGLEGPWCWVYEKQCQNTKKYSLLYSNLNCYYKTNCTIQGITTRSLIVWISFFHTTPAILRAFFPGLMITTIMETKIVTYDCGWIL